MSANLAALRTTLDARLANYFSTLLRCGEVSPAARYRLEGFLQAALAYGVLSDADLHKVMQAHISTFNATSGRPVQPQAEAWGLPYQAPVAPVK